MSEEQRQDQVRSRNDAFVARTATRIWSEQASDHNPYNAARALCHGYDLFELMEKRNFVDVFFLLFYGELPTKSQTELFQALMIALINPGPRHPATRAAMNAGIGKSNPLHILPIAASVFGGEYMGAGEIENAMRFFQDQKKSPQEFAHEVVAQFNTLNVNEKNTVVAGFGVRNGGIETLSVEIAERLVTFDAAGPSLKWGCELNKSLQQVGVGWLMAGVAAAIFVDFGLHPRMGACLFQLLGAPGMLAHGLEMAGKPLTAMPFVSDEHYVIER